MLHLFPGRNVRVGCSKVALNYNGSIFFHCAPKGEKLDNMIRNPRVCFEIDVPLSYLDIVLDSTRPICHLHQFYHCVIIRGSASVVKDSAKKVTVLNTLIAKHENTKNFEQVTESMPGFKACKVIEVKPATITAKSDLGQNIPKEDRRAIVRYLSNRGRQEDRETVKAMKLDLEKQN